MTTIRLVSEINRTPRVMQIEGMFDIDAAERSVTEIPLNIPDLTGNPWRVGLIVGPSGAGKSTVAREMFGRELQALDEMKWATDGAVVDSFPADMPVRDVTALLSSVGFSSPPAWLRPFHALSNGEQFRVSMARLLAEQRNLAVVDEFTSVVDRTVAKVGSHAIAKTVRRRKQKLVAVTCHYDVEDWLQPDWMYQPHTGEFSWRSVQPRPKIEVEFVRSDHAAWRAFSRHHYLNHSLSNSSAVVVALVDGQPAALCATLPHPHGRVKDLWRVSRIVVLPDFQGIGLANVILDRVGGAYTAMGRKLGIVTSHPALMRSMNAGSTWRMIREPSRVPSMGVNSGLKGFQKTLSRSRLTTSFRYVGGSDDTLLPLYRVAA